MSDNLNIEKALNEIDAKISEKLPDNPNLQSIQEFRDLCLMSNQDILAGVIEEMRNDTNLNLIVPEIYIKLYSNEFFKSEMEKRLKFLDNLCVNPKSIEVVRDKKLHTLTSAKENYCFSKLDTLQNQDGIYTQEIDSNKLEISRMFGRI